MLKESSLIPEAYHSPNSAEPLSANPKLNASMALQASFGKQISPASKSLNLIVTSPGLPSFSAPLNAPPKEAPPLNAVNSIVNSLEPGVKLPAAIHHLACPVPR